MSELSQLVKRLKRRGLTQKQIGERVGCHQSIISLIENKRMPRGPTWLICHRLQALDRRTAAREAKRAARLLALAAPDG